MLMYAVSEPESFTVAATLLTYLRQEMGTERTIFLVANKTDLVRRRLVSSHGEQLWNDRWMDGWMDGWIYECMSEWVDG